MMKKTLYFRSKALISAIVAIAMLSACSSTKTTRSATETLSNTAVLEYRMPSTSGYSYNFDSSSEQNMEIQGQAIAMSTNSLFGFSTANRKTEGGSIKFDVVIDTAGMNAASMMETFNTDLNLKGKQFTMTVQPTGKVTSYGQAADISFTAGSAGENDLASLFSGVLPTFDKKEASPGDIWAISDTTEMKSRTSQITTITTGTATFIGFVTLNNRRCAQITNTISGTRSGKMNSQGMDLLMKFPFTGTETIWFDSAEGVLVKYESNAKGDGEIEVSGMGMTIPVSMTTSSVLTLIK